jgi:hypothetical protein
VCGQKLPHQNGRSDSQNSKGQKEEKLEIKTGGLARRIRGDKPARYSACVSTEKLDYVRQLQLGELPGSVRQLDTAASEDRDRKRTTWVVGVVCCVLCVVCSVLFVVCCTLFVV